MSKITFGAVRNRSTWIEADERAVNVYFYDSGDLVLNDAISAAAARKFAEDLNKAADAYEALKPNPQKEYEKMLDSLGYGAVIQSMTGGLYTKVGKNSWYSAQTHGHIGNNCFLHSAGLKILFEGAK